MRPLRGRRQAAPWAYATAARLPVVRAWPVSTGSHGDRRGPVTQERIPRLIFIATLVLNGGPVVFSVVSGWLSDPTGGRAPAARRVRRRGRAAGGILGGARNPLQAGPGCVRSRARLGTADRRLPSLGRALVAGPEARRNSSRCRTSPERSLPPPQSQEGSRADAEIAFTTPRDEEISETGHELACRLDS